MINMSYIALLCGLSREFLERKEKNEKKEQKQKEKYFPNWYPLQESNLLQLHYGTLSY